eukprot:TRINITY_DN64602_c0_g1_i1.p1 TRINITY_DN64602_c0_g1~~TRINITY_DN64602_c0_g1_i1.p1  ORF type:complete len:157 (-),score=27.80 TRINITY_DN64602_c0_g1_i1:6-476(-)
MSWSGGERPGISAASSDYDRRCIHLLPPTQQPLSSTSHATAMCTKQRVQLRVAKFNAVAEVREYVVEPESPFAPKVEGGLGHGMLRPVEKHAKIHTEQEETTTLCAFVEAADTRKLRTSATVTVGVHSLNGTLPPMQNSKLWQRRGSEMLHCRQAF